MIVCPNPTRDLVAIVVIAAVTAAKAVARKLRSKATVIYWFWFFKNASMFKKVLKVVIITATFIKGILDVFDKWVLIT